MRQRLSLTLSSAAFVLALLGWTPLGEAARQALVPRDSVGTPQLKDEAVTSRKVKDRSLLDADFKPGQLQAGPQGLQGPQGPQGRPGPQGAKGDPGEPATKLWILLSQDGTQLGSSGVVGTSKSTKGLYSITFNRDVSHCAHVASSDSSTYSTGTYVDPAAPATVRVGVWSESSKSSVDAEVSLVVAC